MILKMLISRLNKPISPRVHIQLTIMGIKVTSAISILPKKIKRIRKTTIMEMLTSLLKSSFSTSKNWLMKY